MKKLIFIIASFLTLLLFSNNSFAGSCMAANDACVNLLVPADKKEGCKSEKVISYCVVSGAVCKKSIGIGSECAKKIGKVGCNETGGSNICQWVDLDDNMLSKTICNALGIIKGKGGKAFAAFAVIAAGIGFFSGKISWGLLIGVTCGIAIMFGSATIVTAISGDAGESC